MSKENIAIITGASSGMGREFVHQVMALYPKFDAIWVIARRADRLELLRREYPDKKVIPFVLDLTKAEDLEAFKTKLEVEMPNVRLLVNAAGFGRVGRFDANDATCASDMVNLNCMALTTITNLVLQHMPGRSRIINLASIASFAPQPNFAVYAATKAYVLSFSRALRQELKNREITVTAVCPGPVETEFFTVADPTQETPWIKQLMMDDPKAVVEQALWDTSYGKEISIHLPSMKALAVLEKIVPHRIILEYMEKFL
ncbi:MAG: SDR family NAD(P)-dependent oxidoreductase [Lachnospiraceae bacterium]|nr:SDR family NAD(P)-dependent oxidoreductase [Lachnospiraceae bacterium]